MKILRLSGPELIKRISYDDEYDVYERLRYLDASSCYDEFHYLIEDEGVLIGVLSVEINPYDRSVLWVKHIVTDPNHQGRGVARTLIEDFMSDVNARYPEINTVELSTFTDEGKERIKSVFMRNQHLLTDKALRLSYLDRQDEELTM